MKMDYATWGILAAGLLVLALLLWQLLRLRGTLRREREENRRLRDLLQAGSQLAQADQAQLRQLRHDLRHYLTLAEQMPLPAQTAAALRETEGAWMTPEPASESEERISWAIAALERHYQEQASALGFQADLRIIPPHAWDGLLPDLCLLLSNLLENSLEALQREGGGWVRARSVATPGYFSLVVGNTCTRPLKAVNGRYMSSKAPGRFGIGLSTVREVARRYGGQAEFTVENGEFRASLFLPRPSTAPLERSAPAKDEVPDISHAES